MERHAVILILAMIGAFACAAIVRAPDRLRYSHATHLKGEAGCLDCHEGIDRATSFDRTFMPDHDDCARCHAKEEMDRCTYCHSNPERAVRSLPRKTGLIFAHEQHVPTVKGNCMRCHYDVPKAETIDETATPAMATCGDDCHAEDMKRLECGRCHVSLSSYSLEEIRFATHGLNFERRHARTARNDSEACLACHERNWCMDCHSGSRVIGAESIHVERATRSFIHPAPYVALHSMDAETRKSRCETCHMTSFCSSCHASFGVGGIDVEGDGPHPSGWLDPLSTSFHGLEARRRITSCAACHDQGAASVCVRCHQVGGSGGNPHPPGFARRGTPRDNRMCRACHWR